MSRAETGPQEFAYACILILWCLTPLCVIGYADQLGSGVRNLFKYSKHYSGREPEYIEGDVFRIIVPLDDVYSDTGNVQTTQATQAVVGNVKLSYSTMRRLSEEGPESRIKATSEREVDLMGYVTGKTIRELREKGCRTLESLRIWRKLLEFPWRNS